ncbi:hypothetical protein EPN83_03615, partial [Patescibacteria group bacterium]
MARGRYGHPRGKSPRRALCKRYARSVNYTHNFKNNMAKILGIDLGTTNSAMAIVEGGEPR